MSAAEVTMIKDRSDADTMAGKKRKIDEDEVKTEDVKKEKVANKKKRMDTFLKFQHYLDNIIVFHNEMEVHSIIDSIIDGRIESIVKELGIRSTLLRFFPVPRTELLEEVKRIVLNGVHAPLKILINRMPRQIERLVDLTSSVEEDESIMPEVCRLVENDIQREEEEKEKEKKTDSKRPVAAVASFRKMIIRLQNIRYNILKMIAEALRSESLWKNVPVNPINNLKKPALITICKEIYVSIVPFSVDFSRFFIDDEEGVDGDLDEILGDD
uniref:Wsv310-like protein n=1 Tax=Hemigrapsus takanoi nimavirus TaxID=2133792 RepID=A0A401IP38_9VIRU|nr:MAG: wsv310-like protein [Hemigrapsus takanoi nimavirus]GBG35375.1 wsv310-like protein [Hemigrapsus takanoi nimavirus]